MTEAAAGACMGQAGELGVICSFSQRCGAGEIILALLSVT